MFSEIVSKIEPSASLAISAKAKQMKQQGLEVIDLSVGQPDFPLASNIKQAIEKALAENKTGYTESRGIVALREAIAKDIAEKRKINYSAEEILVTPGAKQAILTGLTALLNQGDEVIAFEPCWHSYKAMIQIAGGVYLPIAAFKRGDLQAKAREIASLVSPKTKAILLNNPANPTGAVWSQDDLGAIADIAQKNNLWVMTDEVYDQIVFPPYSILCFASLPEMRERTILVNGFSKTYAMTGLRLGYLAGPKAFIDNSAKLNEHSSTCACSLSQYAGLEALSKRTAEYVAQNQKQYQARRDFIFQALSQPPFFCLEPQGAFYAFFGLSGLNMNSMQMAQFFLEKAKVALVPGAAFGQAGEGYLRMSFAVPLETLQTAISRMKATWTGSDPAQKDL